MDFSKTENSFNTVEQGLHPNVTIKRYPSSDMLRNSFNTSRKNLHPNITNQNDLPDDSFSTAEDLQYNVTLLNNLKSDKLQNSFNVQKQDLHPTIIPPKRTDNRIFQNPFNIGEHDLHPNITHQRNPNGGMLLNPFTAKKPRMVDFYPTFPKFDNDELLPPKWENPAPWNELL